MLWLISRVRPSPLPPPSKSSDDDRFKIPAIEHRQKSAARTVRRDVEEKILFFFF